MIKVSVMYPAGDDVTFDIDYYRTTHFEIVDRTMKPTKWEIDSGVDGPYVACGHLYFDDMETMQAAMGNAGESQADIPNFTNAQAAVQIANVIEA